ncbi:hypothetical protein MMC22_011169 [Lobaria immixta]|nr:hypothetical protein [Lobaria immixta]
MSSLGPGPTVKPSDYGGYGKSVGAPYGGLEGRIYNSRCPPVVTPDTTIIAVCGPNDCSDNAHPKADGWFFSDFFLFHHLFRGTAKQQYWMTCVHPEDLIKKYGEFAHGDPRTHDRRIVLDASMKDDVKDILVFKGNDLLERFLSYVSEASMKVKGTTRPILVLVFGHGVKDIYSITIGGTGLYKSCPKLTRPKFNEALLRHNPDPNVAMLLTSCYGGGWIQTEYLNITAMAGVDHKAQLLSWPESSSIGRCCGSRYSTGVAKALIKTEIEGLTFSSEDGEEVIDSPTFAALVEEIHKTLTKEIDVRENNNISFAAKDDVWDMEWRARTGFPLTNYLEKWESLRLVQKSSSTGSSQSASIRFSDTISLSTSEAEFRIKRLAYDYMKSNPGPDAAAKNHRVHGNCNRLLRGENIPNSDLEYLAGELRFRLETIMGRATEYKDRLGIPFPDCSACDVYKYMGDLFKNKEKDAKFDQIYRMVSKFDLFDSPEAHEGFPYAKGHDYLSMVFCESGWGAQRVKEALDELSNFRAQHSKPFLTVRTLKFWDDRTMHKMIGTIAQSAKKRLRSRSPVKHQRRSLEGVFQGPAGH